MLLHGFIEGDKVLLRSLSVEDIEGDYVHWLNDPEVCAYNSHHVFPYTESQARQYVTSVRADKTNLVLAIVAVDSQKHIGNISLQNIDPISRNAEYAILVGNKEYWGKGIATEASMLILKHGFASLNLHRIYCGTSSANVAMQKLAVSLGMSQEGIRKEAHFKHGSYHDIIEFGILKKDFTV